MKRFTLIVLSLCLSATFASNVHAQGLLRGLADKAKDKVAEKVTNKVTSKVGGKLGKALGVSNDAAGQPASAATTAPAGVNNPETTGDISYEYDNICPQRWTEGDYFDLERANKTGERDDHNNDILRFTKSTLHFASRLDLMNALPPVPTVHQIVYEGEEGPTAEALINYSLACKELEQQLKQTQMETAMAMASVMQQGKGAAPGASSRGGGNPILEALGTKMMTAMLNSGLDLDNASEADIQKAVLGVLSKELGIPEADLAKVMQMAESDPDAATAYVMKNYPNVAKKFAPTGTPAPQVIEDEAADEFFDIFEEAAALASDPDILAAMQKLSRLNFELTTLGNELLGQWASSEACSKICAMETELDAKLQNHMQATQMNYNDEAPDFWVEGRKAQNAVIDSFNEQIAEQWRAKVQEVYDTIKPHALRMAEVDARLDAARAKVSTLAPNDMLRYQMIIGSYDQISLNLISSLPVLAMDAPRISHVLECWMP